MDSAESSLKSSTIRAFQPFKQHSEQRHCNRIAILQYRSFGPHVLQVGIPKAPFFVSDKAQFMTLFQPRDAFLKDQNQAWPDSAFPQRRNDEKECRVRDHREDFFLMALAVDPV